MNDDFLIWPFPPPRESAKDDIPVPDGDMVSPVLSGDVVDDERSGSVVFAAGVGEKEKGEGDAVAALSRYDGKPVPEDFLYDFGINDDSFSLPLPPERASANDPIPVLVAGRVDDEDDDDGGDCSGMPV